MPDQEPENIVQDEPMGVQDVDLSELMPSPTGEPEPDPESTPEGGTPEPEPEPQPAKPEPKGGEEPPAKPAEPEPEPEPEPTPEKGEPAAKPPEFNAQTFAEEQGLPADLFAKCQSETDALKVLTQAHKSLQSQYGKHTEEVGNARKLLEERDVELAELRGRAESASGGPAPTAEGARPAPDTAQTTVKPMTDEERDQFHATWDEDPRKALKLIEDRAARDNPQVAELRAEVERLKLMPQEMKAEEEYAHFAGKHPGWRERLEPMRETHQALGFYPPWLELYELAGKKISDPEGHAEIVGEMRTGVPYAKANELRELRQLKAQQEAGGTEPAATTVEKGRTATAPATTRGNTPPPPHTNAVGIRQVFDEENE